MIYAHVTLEQVLRSYLGFIFRTKIIWCLRRTPCFSLPVQSLRRTRFEYPVLYFTAGDWYLCVCKAEDAQLPPCPSQFGYKTRIHAAESIILYNWVLIFLYTHQCWSRWDKTCAVQGDSHFFTFLKTFGTRWCVWNYWRCKRSPPPDSLALKVIFFQNLWCCSKYQRVSFFFESFRGIFELFDFIVYMLFFQKSCYYYYFFLKIKYKWVWH